MEPNDLLAFKLQGEHTIKRFNSPVGNMINYNDWILGYCIEESFSIKQKVLSISRYDKSKFEPKQPYQDIAHLKEVFPSYLVSFSRSFEHRGFTTMYIIK